MHINHTAVPILTEFLAITFKVNGTFHILASKPACMQLQKHGADVQITNSVAKCVTETLHLRFNTRKHKQKSLI